MEDSARTKHISTSIIMTWGSIILMFLTYDPTQIKVMENVGTGIFYTALCIFVFSALTICYRIYQVRTLPGVYKFTAASGFFLSGLALVTQGYNYSHLSDSGSNLTFIILLHLTSAVFMLGVINHDVPYPDQIKYEDEVYEKLEHQAAGTGTSISISSSSSARSMQAAAYTDYNIFAGGIRAIRHTLAYFFPGAVGNVGSATTLAGWTLSALQGVFMILALMYAYWVLKEAVNEAMNSYTFARLSSNVQWFMDLVTRPFWSDKVTDAKDQQREEWEEALKKLRDRQNARQVFREGYTCRLVMGAILAVALMVFAVTESLSLTGLYNNGIFNLVLYLTVVCTGYLVRTVLGTGCKGDIICHNLLILWVVCAAVFKSTTGLSAMIADSRGGQPLPLFPFLLFILQSNVIAFLYYSSCMSDEIPEESVFNDIRFGNMDRVSEISLNVLLVFLMLMVFGTTVMLYLLPVFNLASGDYYTTTTTTKGRPKPARPRPLNTGLSSTGRKVGEPLE
jgi:hypothetical protein